MRQRIHSNSECALSISHDGKLMLSVRFEGSPQTEYQYYPVSRAVAKNIGESNSIGRTLNSAVIRNKNVTMIRKTFI